MAVFDNGMQRTRDSTASLASILSAPVVRRALSGLSEGCLTSGKGHINL